MSNLDRSKTMSFFFFCYFMNRGSNTQLKKKKLIETYPVRDKIYSPERKKSCKKAVFIPFFLWTVKTLGCQYSLSNYGSLSHCFRDWQVSRILSACLYMALSIYAKPKFESLAGIIKTLVCSTCTGKTILSMVVRLFGLLSKF